MSDRQGQGPVPVLAIEDLHVHFETRRGVVRAVQGVSLALAPGESLGLVGESGCGKSTVARTVVGPVEPTHGDVRFEGTSLVGLSPAAMRPYRRHLQMVFQDPYASLNPRMTVASTIGEPMRIHRTLASADVDEAVCGIMELVGLDPSMRRRYPHEFSGGQRQRIGLARALALEPAVILLDEPVSALDVSVQAQVLNLLVDLKGRLGLTYLFIAHHLAVVRHMSDRVAVMYLGKIVEQADKDTIYAEPIHPYTEALLSAIPVPDPVVEAERRRIPIEGEVPSPTARIEGCPFRSRCSKAIDRCVSDAPELKEHRPRHWAACHLPE